MKIKVPAKEYGVAEFYDVVAKEIGFSNTTNLNYDCREINVATNIQDGFFNHYIHFVHQDKPWVSEKDIRVETAMLLAIYGPKVDEALEENEVEVFDGFIC